MNFRTILLITCSLPLASCVRAQETPSDVHQATLLPASARYQIVQSELAARLTFRLDRYTGRISQIVENNSGDVVWEDMVVRSLPSVAGNPHPRFQVFTSGLAAKFTFLMDCDTGSTWQLQKETVKDKEGKDLDLYSWNPLPS